MSQLINPPPFVNDYERALKLAGVRWTMPGWCYFALHVSAILAGEIYYMPIFIPERTLYDRIGIWVQVGDGLGGLAELRIYNWAGGLPTSQVLAPGTVSTNAAGAQEIVIAETLERGYYFLALRGDTVCSLAGIITSSLNKLPVSGFARTNAQNGFPLSILRVNAAMADPAPAPANPEDSRSAFVRLREA